ncbi:MAG: NADP-dependent phosphogluconate dehydrogenase [Pseudomonadota bacterium]
MATASMGLIGVGTMGSALALNMADHGYDVTLYNLKQSTLDALIAQSGHLAPKLHKAETIVAMVAAMAAPRAVILLVPAGAPVDAVIDQLLPLLEPGDVIIDGGNSDFRDTIARTRRVESAGLAFLGVGVSGGAEGARHGPSMMAGGTAEVYASVQPILEAIAAQFKGDPCVAHLGPDGAGHFTKTVHNGIEYADMQLIAEVYGCLRDGEGRSAAEIAPVFRRWNDGRLKSYMVEITAEVLAAKDPETDGAMVDVIVDAAGQKGTGRWTVIEAIRMGQSASIIEAAVGARVLSSEKPVRVLAEPLLTPAGTQSAAGFAEDDLEQALLVGRILAYAQGFRILRAASEEFGWELDFARIAEIWRAGCIIRSDLLDDIAQAFRGELPAGKLILSPSFRDMLTENVACLRRVVATASLRGLPVPALAAALTWFDSVRTARGYTDLTQAQRDYFGAHSFARVDGGSAAHHGPWHGHNAGA